MVQKAQMSSGQAGGGGENTLYYVLIGATCLGTGVYVSTPFMIRLFICIYILNIYIFKSDNCFKCYQY